MSKSIYANVIRTAEAWRLQEALRDRALAMRASASAESALSIAHTNMDKASRGVTLAEKAVEEALKELDLAANREPEPSDAEMAEKSDARGESHAERSVHLSPDEVDEVWACLADLMAERRRTSPTIPGPISAVVNRAMYAQSILNDAKMRSPA